MQEEYDLSAFDVPPGLHEPRNSDFTPGAQVLYTLEGTQDTLLYAGTIFRTYSAPGHQYALAITRAGSKLIIDVVSYNSVIVFSAGGMLYWE